MLTSEARALVTEIQDRLIELYCAAGRGTGEQNPDRARELQVEIDKATTQQEEIQRRAPP
jgi:molybdenum-dependent DNA-binding transcriptional regulator ModE